MRASPIVHSFGNEGASTHEFVECPACAAKPGSPDLCASCLHNRTAIHRLEPAREALREVIVLATPLTQLTEAQAKAALFDIYQVAAKAYGLKRGM